MNVEILKVIDLNIEELHLIIDELQKSFYNHFYDFKCGTLNEILITYLIVNELKINYLKLPKPKIIDKPIIFNDGVEKKVINNLLELSIVCEVNEFLNMKLKDRINLTKSKISDEINKLNKINILFFDKERFLNKLNELQ